MNNLEKQPKFEIGHIIEQRPFENTAVQAFFKKWCEINDSLEPQIVDRVEYERKSSKGILEKRPDGKQNLYIPDSLKLWEMVGIMEAIDKDTFREKPKIWQEKSEEILELGKTFRDAGAYIARRLNYIGQGKEIASALAEEFYNYGDSLINRKKAKKEAGIRDIAKRGLSSERTTDIDRWLAGDDLYESRKKIAEKAALTNPKKRNDFYETERQKTLAQFFRVAQKAFELQQRQGEKLSPEATGLRLKPWQSDTLFHSAFLRKIERAMQKQIEIPKIELESSIFRRGMELLRKNMPFDKLPVWVKDNYLHWRNGEKTLREALKIDSLKLQLEMARKFGRPEEISARERQIADKIQSVVGQFEYKPNAHNPSEIIASQELNCVGFSMLGGALMKEAGLNYLVADVPHHSLLFLITSDGHVEWRDMQNISFNEDFTDEMIKGKKKDGSPIKVADIAAFSKKSRPEGLMFDMPGEKYREKLHSIKKGERQYITIFGPEYGQKMQVLNNTGNALFQLGRYEEALEAYRQLITFESKKVYSYRGAGLSFSALKRDEEAIKMYRRAIAINPEDEATYNPLGISLHHLKRDEEAVEAYRKAISINPSYADPYYNLGASFSELGRNEEAIDACQKFIELYNKLEPDYNYWIEKAKKKVEELKNKK